MQIDKFSSMTWFVLITGLTRSLSVLKLEYREIDFITSSPDINVLDYKKNLWSMDADNVNTWSEAQKNAVV